MSDSIKHNGKKYFEEGLLVLANKNCERRNQAIKEVFDVLDDQLGDTDPHTDVSWDEWDDDELKAEHPLLWCCRRLSRYTR